MPGDNFATVLLGHALLRRKVPRVPCLLGVTFRSLLLDANMALLGGALILLRVRGVLLVGSAVGFAILCLRVLRV